MTKSAEKRQPGEISATEGARRLGITAQAVGMWAKRPGAPVRVDGRRVFLAWPSFARWREQQLVDQGVQDATKKLRELLERATASPEGDPMTRLTKANARKAEIEVELLERSVVHVADAEAVVEKLLTDLRSQLMPFPRTAAPKLIGAKTIIELEQLLDGEMHRLMETLADPPAIDGENAEVAA